MQEYAKYSTQAIVQIAFKRVVHAIIEPLWPTTFLGGFVSTVVEHGLLSEEDYLAFD
jgi:hypothetical protein